MKKLNKFLEWSGALTAIIYSLLVAFNIGLEFIAFAVLLLSAFLIALWAYKLNHKGILFLQFFYSIAAIVGMIRWFDL